MSLASISIRNPVFAWMLMLGLIVFGTVSFKRLGVSQFPDVDYPVINISATLEGAAPEVMESDVADVLEDAVMSVEGIREVSSTSRQGSTAVTIEFDLSRNIDLALQDVQARVSQAGRSLPRDLDPPIISKTNPEDQPIMWVALTGTRSPQELAEYAKNTLRDKFLTVPGIGEVRLGGYLARNVRIWVDGDKLRQRGLGVDQVIQAIQRQHVELPAGRIEGPTRVANVRVEGEALNVAQWRDLQVGEVKGSPIYLKDVALVEDGFEDRTRLARSNELPAQGMGIVKQRGSNAVSVAKGVHQRIAGIRNSLPEGMSLDVRVDNTVFIETAAKEIQRDLLLAVLLTALVCWLFLGSISSTFNVVLAIPVSVFGTFTVMYFAGFTMNTFTLLALSLSIGIVVDDAIMVLENIYRHAEEGEDRVTAARAGTEQITFAALAATLAIIAIFLPVAFMSGIIGKFFFQFGVVLSVAVLISLLEALTFAPARCSQFLRVGTRGNAVERAVGAAFAWLSATYRRLLGFCLRWRWATLLVAGAIFASSLLMVRRLQFEFTPAQDQGFFMVRVNAPVGSSLDYTDEVMRKVEKVLKAQPEIKGQLAITGAGDLNSGMMFVTLTPRDQREQTQQQIIAKLRPMLNIVPGTRVSLQDFSTAGFSSGRGFPVEFTVRGPQWGELANAATKMMTEMRNSGMMVDVDTDYRVGLPEVKVAPDRDKCLANGVDVQQVAQAVNALVGGQRVARYRDAGRRYDVRLRLLQDERLRPEDIGGLYVRNSAGRLVTLAEVTNISVEPSLQSITRKQRERAVTVFANPAPGVSQEEALNKVEEIGKTMPDGYRVVLAGSSQVFRESISGLLFAMALGLFVAYMVLGSQFNSFIHPVTVLMALPFSVTGALIALVLSGSTMNIFSMIGLILLLGIVKKNSILLVDYTNQMRRTGLNVHDSLMKACPVRLRPILMTTVAMIAGAIPGALAHGAGAELRKSMNIAVIGGLIVSTMLTLVVVPCFYSVVDQAIEAVKRRVRRRRVKPEAALDSREAVGK
jgi:multidrug efflux pump